MTWSDTFLGLLKDNDVRLISYVPDNVLTPLIKGVSADNNFLPVGATREDEAVGTVTGAYMAELRGAVMMQTSGFALRAATGGITDIVAVARGAGISNSEWVRDEAHFERLIDRGFNDGGPMLLAAKIDDEPGKGHTPRDPTLIRSRFMKGLGTGRGSALEV
jgi:hypothetical protein